VHRSPGSILVAWIGLTDLRALTDPDGVGLGPIGQAVDSLPFDRVDLLSNFPDAAQNAAYLEWLRRRTRAEVHLHSVTLTSPTAFGEIYTAADRVLASARRPHRLDPLRPVRRAPP
jgi:hypothetical protein